MSTSNQHALNTVALPVDEVLTGLSSSLANKVNAILLAPPGAGKTTRVPLFLLAASWLHQQRIILLEPRRLAARAAATWMSQSIGEPVGHTVGYRTRLESKIGAKTRIEVVTEGILTRMLQQDPALEGIGVVIFDEFHERSLHADLGLALCLDCQLNLRPELRLLIMSATLDSAALSRLLPNAPVITSTGKMFPVATHYLSRANTKPLEHEVVAQIRRILNEQGNAVKPESAGDILVFLPGAGEIRRVEALLLSASLDPTIRIMLLYGDMPVSEQIAALSGYRPGQRKIILSTSIAETSLTIEGIGIVIDSGMMRVPRFDPKSGMNRLETIRVSKDAADQRRGRAGRLHAGQCYRLWTEYQQANLMPQRPAELLEADLAPLALELACWGIAEPGQLRWLDSPPAAAFSQARELLALLGALGPEGRITAHGRTMADLGIHPRLAHMVLRGKELGQGVTACQLAALLGERDVLTGENRRDTNLELRLEVLHTSPPGTEKTVINRVLTVAKQLQRRCGIAASNTSSYPRTAGLLLAFAYPDRIALRRTGHPGRYLLSNGRGVYLENDQDFAREDCLVAALLDGQKRESRIFLAAPLSRSDLEEHFRESIVTSSQIFWDNQNHAVQAKYCERLGALILREAILDSPNPTDVSAAMLTGIRELGLTALPWTSELRQWQARILLLRQLEPELWPDVSDIWLLAHLEDWLSPWLDGITRRDHLTRLALSEALQSLLTWTQQQQLEVQAPTHLPVPSGSRLLLDYNSTETPILAVRLQELFGLQTTPRIASGRIPVTLHLLSPARRPVQVTQDLASFWRNTYHDVKKDLKGRYPKHYWPDDPYQATPTRQIRRNHS